MGKFLRRLAASLAILAIALPTGGRAQIVAPGGAVPELAPISADAANAQLGLVATPPFQSGTQVDRMVTTAPVILARTFIYNPAQTRSGSLGSWLMPVAQLRGKSQAQYLDFWALPITAGSPVRNNAVAFVLLPAGIHLWSGLSGPITSAAGFWGNGGGAQYYVGPQANLPPGSYQTSAQMFFVGAQPMATIQPYGPRLAGSTARVGAYLDALSVTPFSDLDSVLTQLDVLPLIDGPGSAQLTAAVRSIGPQEHAALSILGLRQTASWLDVFARRGGMLPAPAQPAVATLVPAGPPQADAGVGRWMGPRPGVAEAAARLPAIDAVRDDAVAWFRAGGGFGSQNGGQDLTGFTYQTYGGAGGVDTVVAPGLTLGVGAAVAGAPLTWDDSGGSADMVTGALAAYGAYHPGGWFLDGAVIGGHSWTSARRNIAVAGVPGLTAPLARTADSDQTAWSFGSQLDGGLDLAMGGLRLAPLVGLAYARFSQGAFSEQGAGSLALAVHDYATDSLHSRAGIRLGAAFVDGAGRSWQPDAQLIWSHALIASAPQLTAGLAGQPGSFTIGPTVEPSDAFLPSLGLGLQLGSGLRLELRYEGEFSHDRQAHGGLAGLEFRF